MDNEKEMQMKSIFEREIAYFSFKRRNLWKLKHISNTMEIDYLREKLKIRNHKARL